MFFMALATDFDGTLAQDGVVTQREVRTLREIKDSGRRVIMVTGRELSDLKQVFPELAVCDLVVAENGATLYRPDTDQETPLGPPPAPEFVDRLRRLGVTPLSVGRSIVATREPNERKVLEAIRDLGLELQVVFNKGAVMVLPANVNKATGLMAALAELELSPHNVVGIGDAENDHAFLSLCGCAVAVANALPALKAAADIVTREARGAGLTEFAERLIESDLREVSGRFASLRVPIGETAGGDQVSLGPHFGSAMIAGMSGGGKSTLVAGFMERLNERGFQFCVVDPEGDYSEFEGAVVAGSATDAPRIDEVLMLLARPDVSLVVNLLALDMEDRPGFFAQFLPRLSQLRSQVGRPHWIVIDEAHHMLPTGWQPAPLMLPKDLPATMYVTVHPDQVALDARRGVDHLIVIGRAPRVVFNQFCGPLGEAAPDVPEADLAHGAALLWDRRSGGPVRAIKVLGPKAALKRHVRKYAEGELSPDRSFYFCGPDGRLNLRAQNLSIFLQIAEGVDDATWLHHLRAGDYSRWFASAIKDDDLARQAALVEGDHELDAARSRALIRELVADRYTGPASG